MADHWIVSNYKFYEHHTLEAAEKELKRISEANPDQTFRLYRIKPTLNPSESKAIIKQQEAEIERLKQELHAARNK